MREISLPLPVLLENEQVEINVKIGNNRKIQNYKVEAFLWECKDDLTPGCDETSKSLARICRLKKSIESYDNSWELIQIFAPLENSEYIRVLYRKKNK